MLVELRQAGSEALLDRLDLENAPQPGRWLETDDQSFLVLQRRHRYTLRNGRYEMLRWPFGQIPGQAGRRPAVALRLGDRRSRLSLQCLQSSLRCGLRTLRLMPHREER